MFYFGVNMLIWAFEKNIPKNIAKVFAFELKLFAPSPTLFGPFLWVLLGLARLWTMNNHAVAKTDPDARHAFPTLAGSVVTARLSQGWLC